MTSGGKKPPSPPAAPTTPVTAPTRSGNHSVGAVTGDRVHGGGGDQLGRLLPARAHEPAAPTLAAVAPVGGHLSERRDRVRCADPGRAPSLEQAPAHVRVPQTDRGVRVPGERRAARAAARLVVGTAGIGPRVVDRLALPGDQPVLDVHVPRARAGAVDAVRRADDLVVPPPVAVGRLPVTAAPDQHAPTLGARLALAEELVGGEQRCVPRHGRKLRGRAWTRHP
jgi:hypothetical protein